MQIFRFMCIEEFRKYYLGETLINTRNHHELNQRTNSVGFCFFDLKDFKAEEAMHFLTGIVNTQICAIFDTDKKLKQTHGRYHSLNEKPKLKVFSNYDDMIEYENAFIATEYCTKKYSNKDFKLIKYTIPNWFTNEWKWYKED